MFGLQPGVEGKRSLQGFAGLLQLLSVAVEIKQGSSKEAHVLLQNQMVLSLQVATTQLKQGDRHVLPGLTAILIHLRPKNDINVNVSQK